MYEIRHIRPLNSHEYLDGYVKKLSANIRILEGQEDDVGRPSSANQTGAGAVANFGAATEGLASWGLTTALITLCQCREQR